MKKSKIAYLNKMLVKSFILSLGLSVVQGREAGEPKEKKGKSLLDDDDDEEEVVDESPEEVGRTMILYRAKHHNWLPAAQVNQFI